MNVLIDTDVFKSCDTQEKVLQLSFLLHLIVYNNRYHLMLNDDVSQFPTVETINYFQPLLIEAFNATIMECSVADCTVKVGGEAVTDQKIFSPEEAILYLMQPVSVLVENVLNDAHFLRAVMRMYDKRRSCPSLLQCEKNHWLQFENAGGCGNVKNCVQSRIEYFDGKTKFLRMLVVIDSDKRLEPLSQKAVRCLI